MIKRFINCTSGATGIEYGLIAVLISIAIIAGANGVATALDSYFSSVNSSL